MTCYQEITCPDYGSNQVMKSGRSASGTQRYRCQHSECKTKTFMLAYRYKACRPGIKEQVVEMAISGSGIHDTARVLKINKNTVISTLKKVERPRPGQSKFSDLEFGSKFGGEIRIGLCRG
jgi:transposase-like protein